MQFLHEEFFGKTYRFIKDINIFPIRLAAKLVFWGALFAVVFVLTWLYFNGRQKMALIIVGVLIFAELAHVLRKSMERRISQKLEESGNIQDQLKDADVIKEKKKPSVKKKGQVLNKGGLLKEKVVKKKLVAPKGVPLKGKKNVIGKKDKVINKDGLLKKK